jgi:hypothetical protein
MPSELEQLSLRGSETYMVRTVEFFKVGVPCQACHSKTCAQQQCVKTMVQALPQIQIQDTDAEYRAQ